MNKNELYQRFSQEFKSQEKQAKTVTLVLDFTSAWALFCNIQLALRHPGNTGSTGKIARAIAQNLEKEIAVTPAIREVARRGWEQAYDE